MGRKYYIDPDTGEKIYIRDKAPGLAQYRKATDQDVIDAKKTEKTRIDFDGEKFTLNGSVLNYKQLHDIHLGKPDFAFIVYGDRAYLLSYVQDDPGQMREMRWESSIATQTAVKTSGIYIVSNDGIEIAGVSVRDINSENQGNKVAEFTEANKNSTTNYPSNAAVNKELNELKVDLSHKVGYSEVVDGQLLMYSDATKAHLLATLDLPGGGVSDVQVNGTSVVQDGVANIPAAANGERGVVSVNKYGSYGISAGSYGGAGSLSVQNASTSEIDKRGSAFFPITPNVLPYAVKSVMSAPVSTTDPAWTAEEQLAGRQRLGLDKEWELIATITCDGNTLSYDIRADADGNPFTLSDILASFEAPSGAGISTSTVFLHKHCDNSAYSSSFNGAVRYATAMLVNLHGYLLPIANRRQTVGATSLGFNLETNGTFGQIGQYSSANVNEIRIRSYANFADGTVIRVYGVRA